MIKKRDFKNTVWATPIILPFSNDKNTAMSLTRSQKCKWRFLFDSPADIPSPFANNQDYDFTAISDGWNDITVPGELAMQGYDIKNNCEYYYQTTVSVPKGLINDRLFLRFEGVYSNARVWVDNTFVRSHIGGFTPWDCEISDCVNKSSFTLTIGVSDIEGKDKGIWNPEGAAVSDAAWASYYAHHNIGGILRDITLFSVPDSHFTRIYTETKLDENYKNAVLRLAVQVDCCESGLQAEIKLTDNNIIFKEQYDITDAYTEDLAASRHILDLYSEGLPKTSKYYGSELKYQKRRIAPKAYEYGGFPASFEVEIPIDNPKLWDAEHPRLYTLCLRLINDGRVIQTIEKEIGLREIQYGGSRGTDKNKIYVNGKEIKLRGVCRHDISHDKGRSISDEEIVAELTAYKKNNINFVRTSHYPASEFFLEQCDKIGLYVEQENSACFKGANGMGIYNTPEEFLDTFAEMIESARNHPGVIIWSLANESGFEHTAAFRKEYEYVKQQDTSRPVIFSYPFTVHSAPLPYDIFSKHYAKVTSDLGKKDIPMLHDEFAHIACYNTSRLKNGNGCRAFWGESIKKGWDNIFGTDGSLGCAIWAAIDDVFYLPEGVRERHQHHSTGSCAGYGEWGCILDAYKREKPEAYLTKKAFSPINIINSSFADGEWRTAVENRFDHTDLNEGAVLFKDIKGAELCKAVITQSVAPHSRGTLIFNQIPSECYSAEFIFDSYTVESCCISDTRKNIINTPSKPLKAKAVGATLFLENEDKDIFRLRFFLNSQPEYEGRIKLLSCREGKIKALVSMKRDVRFFATVTAVGNSADITVRPASIGAAMLADNDFYIAVTMPKKAEKISWNKNSLYDIYPDGHLDRPCGAAQRESNTTDFYGVKPTHNWENDKADYFLSKIGDAEAPTRDFLCQRDNVIDFSAHMKGDVLTVFAKTENLRVQTYVKSREDWLLLSRGCYYPDLEWGNYLGERGSLSSKRLAFSLSLK